ncbi:hypothetical protein [Paraburkholderia sp.]|uniref:hypothetical protein n=1 Tax=Paraburkholderia sp. TaxID=1926495 RepID=UPI003D6F5428
MGNRLNILRTVNHFGRVPLLFYHAADGLRYVALAVCWRFFFALLECGYAFAP